MPRALLLGLLTALPAVALEWNFDRPQELLSAVNLRSATVADGLLQGATAWDPYFYLELPAEGVDARKLTRLTLRLYSSAPADLLAIYYQSPDGRWGLGNAMAIVPGWATYRVDLAGLTFRERSPHDDADQWGGPGGTVSSLRIDPGNDAGRWLAVDRVALSPAEGPFTPGVEPEPLGSGRLAELEGGGDPVAGEPITARVVFELPAGATSPQTAVLWLVGEGGEIVAHRLASLELAAGRTEWRVALPTNRYAGGGRYTLRAGLLESDLADGGFAQPRATVTVTNPRAGTVQPPLTELRRVGGDPMMFVDGRPVTPFFVSINGMHQQTQQAEMAAAGIHLFFDWFPGSYAGDIGQKAPGVYDYSAYDNYFAATLAADPEAMFLPHIPITPPLWWQQAHPEELVRYADGGQGPQSFASQLWREETGADLRRLIDHLQTSAYADRILGYCFYSGYSAEWQSWGLWENHLADYSDPAQRAWRDWLAARYADDSALRVAWAQPTVTLAEPPMPTPEQRHTGELGALRDPAVARQVIDYYQFLAELTADAILDFARITQSACGGRSLVGTYYGYLTAHGARQQDSSHLALSKVLESDDLDFLLSPPLYTDRGAGGVAGFMSTTESVQLHGKLWISEADHRTWLSAPDVGYGRTDTPADSEAVLLRELGHVITHRAAVSWYDMVGGWLGGPEITSILGRLRNLQEHAVEVRTPFTGEVAVVIDEESVSYTTAMNPLNVPLSLQTIAGMPRVGVSWDFYLLDDVTSDRVPPHKLYLFLNTFRISEAERTALHQRLEREGATAIWVYAAGYYGDTETGAAAIRDLTGFTVAPVDWSQPLQVAAADDPGATLAGNAIPAALAFAVTEPAAEPLGVLRGTAQIGLARRSMGRWTSLYSAAPLLSAETFRQLAADAGCWIYSETNDSLSVDNRFLCLHAATDGEKQLRLPRTTRVRDAWRDQPVEVIGDRVSLMMKKGETRLLEMLD